MIESAGDIKNGRVVSRSPLGWEKGQEKRIVISNVACSVSLDSRCKYCVAKRPCCQSTGTVLKNKCQKSQIKKNKKKSRS